MEELPNLAKSV